MSYKVLARRWRPERFDEVLGQNHIVNALKNTISQKKIGHSYLFTGTRGVGKTTVARIFAKAIRCQNRTSDQDACGVCLSCSSANSGLDVIEIDGASNNSVDGIRELVANVAYLPSTGDKKVYIIDEVHMLSNSAFNALLKTLEEPPAHVIFVLATTEPEKLLDTVKSRCQRFDFKQASIKELEDLIKKVFEQESITVSNSFYIRQLAQLASGSFRDALSLIEKLLHCSSDKNITEEIFVKTLGLPRSTVLNSVLRNILEGNAERLTVEYEQLVSEDVSLQIFSKEMLRLIFDVVSKKATSENSYILSNYQLDEIIWIYEIFSKDFSWALNSLLPSESVFLCLLKVCKRREFIQASPSDHVKKKVETRDLDKEFRLALKSLSPTILAQLYQGNLVSIVQQGDKILATYSFPIENKIFFDFITDSDITHKIVEHIRAELGCNVLDLNFQLNHDLDKNFLSIAEIQRREFEEKENQRKATILNNNLVKKAENIFQTKVDKVILNKGNNHD